MELEEIKKAWIALNNISKENKVLKETLILNMIQKRAKSSFNKLLVSDIIGFVILLTVLCVCAYAYHFYGRRFLTWDISVISSAVICIIGAVWYYYKINGLMKVNFSKKVSENIYRINKYNILLKKEKIASNLIIAPIIILIVLVFLQVKTPLYIWTIMIVWTVLAVVFTYWSYKRIYQRSVDEILRSLDEIKELEEEREEE